MNTNQVRLDPSRLDLLIGSVVDYGIYMLSADGRVMTWNAGGQRLKGYAPEEIIGQHFSRFFTPEDRAAGLPERALRTAAETGRFENEGWRVRKDGTRFWALAVLDRIVDAQGQVIGFVKITRDMTERRMAEQKLAESEERFRRLVDSVVDYAIYMLDPDGHVVNWNSGAERIKGYRADEIIGQHFSKFYAPEDREAGLPEKVLRTALEQGRYEAEGWRVRKDGTRFWASVVVDPIRDDTGHLLGFAKVTRDITERREAQRRLKEAEEQLVASQKMEAIGQLSGGIAHDFNNLLMIVLGNLETAQRAAREISGPALPTLQRALRNATRGGQRAAALTSRLLSFSRRQPLNPKPIDPGAFLTGAADFLQRTLGETIDVEVLETPGLWTIEADPNHLESALVNLAINARDAMPRGGKLTIEARNVTLDKSSSQDPETTAGQYVLITVSDTGCGMTEDVLKRAFEPFFTTKELGQGTGLGLSQVYGFVRQSGGHIRISSAVNQGTTVSIHLPRYTDGIPDEDDEPDEADESRRGCVLVVEDDPDVRSYLIDVVHALGYGVLHAADGKSALEILQFHRATVHLLLTDVVMPGMNGRELARKAKNLRPGLKVLYMTGYSRDVLVRDGRLDSDVAMIQKPVTRTELDRALHDILAVPATPARGAANA